MILLFPSWKTLLLLLLLLKQVEDVVVELQQ
jgi:hypothetical protein